MCPQVDSKTDLVCFSLTPGLMSMSRDSPYPPAPFLLPVPKVPGSGLRENFKIMRIGVLLHHFQPLSKASIFGLWTHPSREEGKYQGGDLLHQASKREETPLST